MSRRRIALRDGKEAVRASRAVSTGVERVFGDDERVFGDDEIIVSKTDAKGRITYANDVFVRVSAYTEAELMGPSLGAGGRVAG